MITYIYTLVDPETDKVRYVGKTNVKPQNRYNQHIYQWKRSIRLTKVNSWIKHLSLKDKKPKMVVIDNIKGEWIWLEQYWIAQFKTWGFDLTNHTDGGEGTTGYKATTESKEKRLKSLENSELWKEKHKRHSKIMKKKHAEGLTLLGYGHLSDEKRKEIGVKHSQKLKEKYKKNPDCFNYLSEKLKKPVCNITKEGVVLFEFKSVTEAAKFFKIEPTHITRVCKGKSKSGLTKGHYFKYL